MQTTTMDRSDVGTTVPAAATSKSRWPDAWMAGWLVATGRISKQEEMGLMQRSEPTFRQAALATGLVSEREVLLALGERLRLEVVELDPATLDAKVVARVPVELARAHGLVAVWERSGVLGVACTDPLVPGLEQSLAFATGRRIRLLLAEQASIRAALEGLNGDGAADEREAEPSQTDLAHGVNVTELVDGLIGGAIERRASDIHIEPTTEGVRVRYRIDGALRQVASLPLEYAAPLVSRLKVMADLDISDRRRPQDGRAQAVVRNRRVDLRVSTLPVTDSLEKVVLRVLDTGATAPVLADLGMADDELELLRSMTRRHEGMFLVTGPTGSGKTTTLYALLNEIHQEGISVVTVEDPVEYKLPGVTQVQVNTRADLTFASALRSILRQDPDVVLVGEIRDLTTADIAIKASMTGHQVLSTLHTNDAPSAIARLLDMGVDAAVMSGALRGVVAQRLVRRLCGDCREPISMHELPGPQRAYLQDRPDAQLYRAVGCQTCDGTGYRGRVAIVEMVPITLELEHAILRGVGPGDLYELCRSGGMRSLWESGLQRVTTGATTMHELLDTIAAPAAPATPAAAGEALGQSEIDALIASMLGGAPESAATAEPVVAAPVAAAPADITPADSGAASPVAGLASAPRSAAGDRPATRLGRPAARQGKQTRVLLADEDFEQRRALRQALEKSGLRVLEAASGSAVATYLSRMTPDLLVMELSLPKMDGFELLQAMRAGDLPNVPTVVLTAQAEPELEELAYELGAVDFMTKPVDGAIVAARLRAAALGVSAA